MENKKRINKILSILLSFAILITSFPIKVIATESETSAETETVNETPKVLDDEYIYFDLYYGDITLSGTSYTGYVLESSGEVTKKTGTIDRKIYIYQSSGDDTIWENGLPKYDRVGAPSTSDKSNWGEYITNNTDLNGIITNWNTAAKNVNRTSTPNKVSITGTNIFDITIDNLWSSYHVRDTGRKSGGLSFYPSTSSESKATIRLKGDNRFGNIFFTSNSQTKQQMIFEDVDNGTLTLANLDTKNNKNYWDSALGSSDNVLSNTMGLIINGGTIFAGTTYDDNCTAIGAGGNGNGGITINGGKVTAVASTTGTAIGGGIGFTSQGGNAEIEITGGNVYAYNFGFAGIPAAAIGGGSSNNSNGNTTTTITITGGNVYAESVGGTAIGGGSSKLKNGGSATINIGGDAIVTAKSVEGTYNGTKINAGAAIGGGTGGSTSGAYGGNATVNISGTATLYTGSIGGGKTNNSTGKIGTATIEIEDFPTIQGQFIMAAGGGSECSFTMNGGTIDNSNKTDEFVFLQENGGAVYIENGDATMSGGTIKGCETATNGGAIYVNGGDFTMTSGTIKNNTSSNEGGAIYVIDGNIIIGLDTCLGTDDTHSHPIISNNTATNHGGAIAINGGEITMYCGTLTKNTSIQNQASNSVLQTGGVFDVKGGDLGIGILVTGGVFNDLRENQYQVRLHAIYEDVNATVVVYVNNNETLTLPKETEIEDTSFTREGLYLVGWSTSEFDSEGYMLVGNKISITENTDLYAVWDTEEPIASFIVYIPETLTINKNKTGAMDIEAELKYFTNDAKLNVSISGIDGLALEADDNVTLDYELSNEKSVIQDGDVAASLTNLNLEETITAEITEEIIYSGNYTDTLLFTVEYLEE